MSKTRSFRCNEVVEKQIAEIAGKMNESEGETVKRLIDIGLKVAAKQNIIPHAPESKETILARIKADIDKLSEKL